MRDLNPKDITSLDVSIAAGKGDKLAKKIYDFTGEMLGEACADFAAFSSPEAFIFFGGLTKAGDLLMDPIKKSYDEHVLPIFKGKAKFLVSGLDGSSVWVGCGSVSVGWVSVSAGAAAQALSTSASRIKRENSRFMEIPPGNE